MKYLSDYINNKLTEAYKTNGAFYAFSDKQFLEGKAKDKDKNDYITLDMGLICLKKNANKLLNTINNIIKQGIEQDIKENGKEEIIKRELYNHEAFYTWNIDSTVESLAGYNFTRDDIKKVFTKINKLN